MSIQSSLSFVGLRYWWQACSSASVRKLSRNALRAAFAFWAGATLLESPVARADDYQTNILTFMGGVSMWGGNANPVNVDKFLGIDVPIQTLGPINVSLKACADLPVVGETCVGYGADGQASAGGKLGLDFGLHINAGAVNLALPETIGLQYSNAIRTLSSASITMPSNSFALTAGGLSYNSVHGPVSIAGPVMRTYAPSVEAHLNAVAQLSFDASGHICYVYCLSGNVSENIAQTQPLFSIGQAQNGQYGVSVLGQSLGSLPVNVPLFGNVGNLFLNVPNTSTDSTQAGGFDSGSQTIRTEARAPFAGVSLDIPALLGKAFPVVDPLLGEHDLGAVGSYSLLSANIGLYLELQQKFTASIANVGTGFLFSEPVSVNGSGPTQIAGVLPGQSISITAPGLTPLGGRTVGVLPFFNTAVQVVNETSIVPTVAGDVTLLQLSIAGKDLGSVFHKSFDIPVGEFAFDPFTTIATAPLPVIGTPFALNIQPDLQTSAVCNLPDCAGSGSTYNVVTEPCYSDGPDCGAQYARVYRVSADCTQFIKSLCPDAELVAMSPSVQLSGGGTLFTNGLIGFPLELPQGSQGPVDDASVASQWLASNFVAAGSTFPANNFVFPFEITVPEPGSSHLVAIAMLLLVISNGLGVGRRSHRCANVKRLTDITERVDS